ncbi:MAG: ABC transporter permease [Acidimicrobiia bacterium]|nr:ABC transporter permease [Acidimicrobiia bacterium]
MSRYRELLGVAFAGLAARKSRTLLIMLGPTLGVAAIIAAVGLTDSAKGDLKLKLRELGTDLIVAEASSSFGTDTPKMPADAVPRALSVPTVDRVAAVSELSGVVVTPYAEAASVYETVPIPVLAADSQLPSVLDVTMVTGRWLNDFDQQELVRSAVIGEGLADEIDVLAGESRSIDVGGKAYAVVGILERVELDPALNNAVFITFGSAEEDFNDEDQEPNKLYVRADPGTERDTSSILPIAITLGGSTEVAAKIPTDLLEAQSETDTTLQFIVAGMGLLALVVGAVGIANVMSISVIQRSSEIGIRRALGHSRSTVGLQFLLEALGVGILGGLLGVVVGLAAMWVGTNLADWVFVLQPWLPWAGLLGAIIVSMLAGIVPALKAARLEPLETLRLG